MNRPYIFCHMLTSLDGKIMGNYMSTPEGETGSTIFYDLAFDKDRYYKHQGWISGRVTTDDNFTFYKKPDLDEDAEIVPEGDYVADFHENIHYVSIDPSGVLGWDKNYIIYQDTRAHVIEVLTNKASNSYKDLLRKLGIYYIIAGDTTLDYEVLLEKLKKLFKIELLMLGGGGVLNWSFIQEGLCDEVSVVMAASSDGSTKTPTLFMEKEGLSDDKPVHFKLEDVKIMEGDSLWLRYKIKK